jgi:hypothetical protein
MPGGPKTKRPAEVSAVMAAKIACRLPTMARQLRFGLQS